MSVPRLDPVRSSVPLPEPTVLDGLDVAALVEVAERAAALHAGAIARLTIMGRGRVSGVADDDYMTIDDAAALLHVSPEWVYRQATRWSFAVKLAPKVLRIQRLGLRRWLEQRQRR